MISPKIQDAELGTAIDYEYVAHNGLQGRQLRSFK